MEMLNPLFDHRNAIEATAIVFTTSFVATHLITQEVLKKYSDEMTKMDIIFVKWILPMSSGIFFSTISLIGKKIIHNLV